MKYYTRHPFDTKLPVRITQNCGPDHPGAKDLRFDGIHWGEFVPNVGFVFGTPVYAMESGIVRFVRRNSPHCPDKNNCPQYDNTIIVEGNDGYYTQYGHVDADPYIQIGKSINISDPLGFVDNSGVTTAPHCHVARYTPGDPNTWYDRPTCDWRIVGVEVSATYYWTFIYKHPFRYKRN